MNCGYNSTSNEWKFETVRLTSSLYSNQLNIHNQRKGPILHITSDRKNKQDLIRVDNQQKDPVFQITHDGKVLINGSVLKDSNIADVSEDSTTSEINESEIFTEQAEHAIFDEKKNINLPHPSNCIKIDYEPVLSRNRLHISIADTNDGIMMTNTESKKTSWKIGMDSNGDLLFQRLIDGKWITRHSMS